MEICIVTLNIDLLPNAVPAFHSSAKAMLEFKAKYSGKRQL
jgi:hypothetical protein